MKKGGNVRIDFSHFIGKDFQITGDIVCNLPSAVRTFIFINVISYFARYFVVVSEGGT